MITTIKQAALIDATSVKQWRVKIFGAGSIGSVMAVQLAKLGFVNMTIYDYDVVEESNIGSQEFNDTHVGMKKTDAIKKMLKDYYNYDINIIDGKIDADSLIVPEQNTIYFCAFDSLEARLLLWNKLKRFPIIWGETRIGRTAQRYYFVDLRDKSETNLAWIAEYEQSLDVTGPRSELSCGEKGTYPSNAELVSKVCRQIVNIAEGKPLNTLYIGDWGAMDAIHRTPEQEVPKDGVC